MPWKIFLLMISSEAEVQIRRRKGNVRDKYRLTTVDKYSDIKNTNTNTMKEMSRWSVREIYFPELRLDNRDYTRTYERIKNLQTNEEHS